VDRDRVRVVRVLRVAPQLEGAAGRHEVGGERLGMVLRRAGHAGDSQPALGQLRRVAREIPVRFAID
jgi:hypothetical protein